MAQRDRSGRQPPIVEFYDPNVNGGDAHGRTRREILRWDDEQLEQSHDYIQILFPLPEGSMFSYNAPIIGKKTLEAFHSRTPLRIALNESFGRMLKFYGFALVNDVDEELLRAKASDELDRKDSDTPATAAPDDEPKPEGLQGFMKFSETGLNYEDFWHSITGFHVVRGPNFEERSKNWCVRMYHNHLRITRILRSLRVLGLEKQCEAFYKALKDVYNDPKIKIGERSMMFWSRAVREPLHMAPDGTACKWLKRSQETEQTED
ncbi:hypothetical protein BU23DRAFT_444519 [Bimuria novae-zelandiae CBS 107.79]|uniref:Opioid growth factor receptor (OGFr) conserved domain-containing protein n=1 Tax=Bimuria novae-zelandiae CBS 107.79 TaxID=1447943 RepID=A0A6A5VZF7_9PLEO|nr:hypothetical protein BU23DRAFT_444519 [Bimuria novae-zelandiae CBS 107.79]